MGKKNPNLKIKFKALAIFWAGKVKEHSFVY